MSHFFYNMKYSTETPSICIFVCLKMCLTVVIRNKNALNDLLQSSFLLRNTGPSPRIKKWSGGGKPMAREGGEHERGLGGLPLEKNEFLALLCAFLMGFYAFGTRFQSRFFARKDISWRVRKPNHLTKSFSDSHDYFLLFSSAYFLDIMSPMYPQVLTKYF